MDLSTEYAAAIEAGTLMFYLGGQRRAEALLRPLARPSAEQTARLMTLRGHCEGFAAALRRQAPVTELGALLDETWQVKRRLSAGICPPRVDQAYAAAQASGAAGGKLLGAGGTGCLLLMAEPSTHAGIRGALGAFTELPFHFEPRGSRVLLTEPRHR